MVRVLDLPYSIDCRSKTPREINGLLGSAIAAGECEIHVLHPEARHNLGVALLQPVRVIFDQVPQNLGWRIGFLIDAAILGFAVGTGFATVENLYYLERVRDAGMGTWIVRGFGTALMHGGSTAIFAMMSVALLEQMRKAVFAPFVPGLRWRSCCIRRSTTCTFRRGCRRPS